MKIPNSVRNIRAYSKTHLVQNVWRKLLHRLRAGKTKAEIWDKEVQISGTWGGGGGMSERYHF